MISLIEQHRPEVATLCNRFGVQSLEVFGSAADGAFDPAHSDIDFLVDFNPDDQGSLFHRYFVLQEALMQMFHRKIDLVSVSALSNPYFIAAVNRSRQTVYPLSSPTQTLKYSVNVEPSRPQRKPAYDQEWIVSAAEGRFGSDTGYWTFGSSQPLFQPSQFSSIQSHVRCIYGLCVRIRSIVQQFHR